jgi:hypothetical protein
MRKGSLAHLFLGFTLMLAALMPGCAVSSGSTRHEETCTPDDSNLPTPCTTSDQCGAGYECRGGICEHCSYAEHDVAVYAFQPGTRRQNCKPLHVVTGKKIMPTKQQPPIHLSTTTSALVR